jgi:SNF2 family DNA or RNA helicase
MLKIPNGAARFVRLEQILETPALLGGPDDSAILDDLEERVSDSVPEPWVVFTKFKETTYIIKRRLENQGLRVAVYNGDVSVPDRVRIEDEFQRGEIDVIVGTIQAMYQGITLTRGNLQYWVSRSVVPDINEQGEAREDRLGQQQLVRVYIPQPPATVSADKVEVINRRKERTVRAILPKDDIEEVRE